MHGWWKLDFALSNVDQCATTANLYETSHHTKDSVMCLFLRNKHKCSCNPGSRNRLYTSWDILIAGLMMTNLKIQEIPRWWDHNYCESIRIRFPTHLFHSFQRLYCKLLALPGPTYLSFKILTVVLCWVGMEFLPWWDVLRDFFTKTIHWKVRGVLHQNRGISIEK